MWFIFALITTLSWGAADLFYKKGTDENDRLSYIQITICVGLVMGAHAAVYMLLNDMTFNFHAALVYLPISAMYILSMMIGYYGIRFIELSVASPVQNTSGALAALLCCIFFKQTLDGLTISGMIIITIGVVALAVVENIRSKNDCFEQIKPKHKHLAIIYPLLYCVFDALGTFGDAVVLDELSLVSEDDGLVAYEMTFFMMAIVFLIYMIFIKKEKFVIRKQFNRFAAAGFETAGQFFYVFAMAENGVVAAPLIASYAAFSVIFLRLFCKEKLSKVQYALVSVVMAGILLLGISEGLE